MEKLKNFNEYGSVLAFSIENVTGQDSVKQDFVIAGNYELLGRGLGVLMHRHPELLTAFHFAVAMYESLAAESENPGNNG